MDPRDAADAVRATTAAGDHLVHSNVCYAGVAEYADHSLRRQGVEVSAVDTADPQAVAIPPLQLRHVVCL